MRSMVEGFTTHKAKLTAKRNAGVNVRRSQKSSRWNFPFASRFHHIGSHCARDFGFCGRGFAVIAGVSQKIGEKCLTKPSEMCIMYRYAIRLPIFRKTKGETEALFFRKEVPYAYF